MDVWNKLFDDDPNITYVKCRVIKQIGFIHPHKVGTILNVEEKGVAELVADGYVEVIEEGGK